MTLTPTTRASLIFRLRDPQDHEAWVEFVALYEPIAYRLFRRHGLQDADARELVQELFLLVSRNIERWDPAQERGTFRGWLRTVARNLMINWLKHRERKQLVAGGSELAVLFASLPAADEPESAEFNYELRRVLFQQAAEIVRQEVQLTTWHAFWETAVLGASPADVAKKLNLSTGAVRVAKCRVLARLQAAVIELEKSL